MLVRGAELEHEVRIPLVAPVPFCRQHVRGGNRRDTRKQVPPAQFQHRVRSAPWLQRAMYDVRRTTYFVLRTTTCYVITTYYVTSRYNSCLQGKGKGSYPVKGAGPSLLRGPEVGRLASRFSVDPVTPGCSLIMIN